MGVIVRPEHFVIVKGTLSIDWPENLIFPFLCRNLKILMSYCEKFYRISSSTFKLFPYMKTELPYIEVIQNLKLHVEVLWNLTLVLTHKNLSFLLIKILILTHKNFKFSIKIHSFFFQPYIWLSTLISFTSVLKCTGHGIYACIALHFLGKFY